MTNTPKHISEMKTVSKCLQVLENDRSLNESEELKKLTEIINEISIDTRSRAIYWVEIADICDNIMILVGKKSSLNALRIIKHEFSDI